MTIRHIYLWNVKEGQDPQIAVDAMTELNKRVPNASGSTVGKAVDAPGGRQAGSFEYATTLDVASQDDLGDYKNHADQLAIIEKMYEVIESSTWVDIHID